MGSEVALHLAGLRSPVRKLHSHSQSSPEQLSSDIHCQAWKDSGGTSGAPRALTPPPWTHVGMAYISKSVSQGSLQCLQPGPRYLGMML